MRIVFHDSITDLLTLFTACLYLSQKNCDFAEIREKTLDIKDKLGESPGTLIVIGKDSLNNKVFILGRKNEKKIVCQALMSFSRIFKAEEKFTFFNLSPYRNFFVQLASFLRVMRIPVFLVNKVLFFGILLEFDELKNNIDIFADNIKE